MKKENYGTEIIGPFEKYKVSVGGYRVPRLEIVPLKGANDGMVNTVLDERFSVTSTQEEAQKFAALIAHAMAIGAGFSCHGENSVPRNEYKCQIMQLGSLDTDPDATPPTPEDAPDA